MIGGAQFGGEGRGRFALSGAISDRGSFVDNGFQVAPPSRVHPVVDPHVRTLFGAKATIRITVDGEGHWRITKGTKAYVGLRGRGQQRGLYSRRTIDITMTGTVAR